MTINKWCPHVEGQKNVSDGCGWGAFHVHIYRIYLRSTSSNHSAQQPKVNFTKFKNHETLN